MNWINSFSATTLIFYLLAAISVGCALSVAFSTNILHSAFALLGALSGVAGLYFLLGADFVAVVQLLVYVGGIMVLILFAVLLTREISDIKISNVSVSLLAGLPTAFILLALILQILRKSHFPTTIAVSTTTVHRLGDALLREYLLPFEIASVVLLIVLVGAMVISRRAVKEEIGADQQNPEGQEVRR